MAHEINNSLQAVTNLMSLLAQSPRLDSQDKAYAAMAAEELERVTHLTRQSLSFYREATAPTDVDIGELLNGILALYSRRMKANRITVTKRFRLNGTILSYPGEIRQVFATLLLNAVDAVPEGGKLTLHVNCTFNTTDNSTGRGVQITLARQWKRNCRERHDRIFDPFFTTKGEQGTGLRLWVARTIMQRLGGSIRVRSIADPGKSNTCFRVFLPNQIPTQQVR
jgi:signal transduction histidine kinase